MRQRRDRPKLSPYSFLGLLFLLTLISFGALNLLCEDRVFSEAENRYLEQRPVLRLAGIVDGRFMRDYEKYQTDQFFSRDAWIRFRSGADRLLGKNESGGVYLGEGEQLYEKPETLKEEAERRGRLSCVRQALWEEEPEALENHKEGRPDKLHSHEIRKREALPLRDTRL